MPTQPEKATLSVYGSPQSAFDELDLLKIKDTLTQEHKKRLESAIEGDYYVYPRSSKLYMIESVEDGVVNNVYTVNFNRISACSCYDYLMRCTGNAMSCKHIWRIRLLIKLDALPDKSKDPYNWLLGEISEDIVWLKENKLENTRFMNEIKDLKSEIEITRREEIEYKKYMKKRARIMIGATTMSIS